MRSAAVILLALLALSLPVATPAGEELTLDDHGGPVKGVAVSSDGRQAITASFDYSLILWDLHDAAPRAHLYGHDAAVNDVALLPDGRAISASDDGTVGLWDLAGERLLRRLEGHRGKVTSVDVSADGRLAASAAWDRTVRIWDLRTGAELHRLEGRDNLNTVRFTPDGQRLLAGGSDGSIQLWRVADGTQLTLLKAHDFGVTSLALGPDGKIAASASVDETVQLWDLAAGEPTITLFGHEGPVLAVALSGDGELVASGGVDGTVRIWHEGDGDRLRVYQRHHGPVWTVAFAPDGATLLSGGADGLVIAYDLSRPPEEAALDNPAEVAPATAAEQDRGAELFRGCSACHTVTPDGGHRAGPTLYGLFGRTAGSQPGYPYSAALLDSTLVWTEASVARLFEIGPEHFVPGSKMPLQRMPDAADRAELIAYLKRITAPVQQRQK